MTFEDSSLILGKIAVFEPTKIQLSGVLGISGPSLLSEVKERQDFIELSLFYTQPDFRLRLTFGAWPDKIQEG